MSISVPQPVLISIEGDIGAGKTTLIDALKKSHPNWHFIDEPVGQWIALKTTDGTNLLEHFYKDQERWSYTFQNCALLTRAMNIKQKIDDWKDAAAENPEIAKHNVFVTERCLETDFYVFAKMLHDDGKMNLMEWDLYKLWYSYVKSLSYPLSGIVYVSTPPEICAERIGIRGRKGEEHIPIEYLRNLDKYQREWLYGKENNIQVMKYINYGESQHSSRSVVKFIEMVQP